MRKLISLKAARKILKADKPNGISDSKIRTLIKTDPTFPAYLIRPDKHRVKVFLNFIIKKGKTYKDVQYYQLRWFDVSIFNEEN
ncbi:MAG: hypothetical protein ACYC21_12960 [Eubacteriales bacterium]